MGVLQERRQAAAERTIYEFTFHSGRFRILRVT